MASVRRVLVLHGYDRCSLGGGPPWLTGLKRSAGERSLCWLFAVFTGARVGCRQNGRPAVDDGNWIGWLMGIGLAGLLLFQCALEPSSGPDYGPDCVVVYYSNGPMCE